MQVHQTLELILNNKVFPIPSDFNSLPDIKEDIYNNLLASKRYEVKSIVQDDIFQLFIKHWIYKETPNFTQDNIKYFTELSEEFDRMKDIIELYKIKSHSLNILSLKTKNEDLKAQKSAKKDSFNQKYTKIINILLNDNRLNNYSEFLKSKAKLFQACKQENVKKIYLLTRKQIEENGIIYALDEKNKACAVFEYIGGSSNVFIPESIQYNSEKYIVKVICQDSFKKSKTIEKVEFSKDSKLQIIEKYSFYYSSLSSISIPKHVKKIGNSAFALCFRLVNVEIDSDSDLTLIDKSSFFAALIRKIVIPSHVVKIGDNAFCNCRFLSEVIISDDSELISIGSNAFASSLLESIKIPSNAIELKNNWCNNLAFLTNITVLNNNKNFIFYDDKFLIEKSDPKSDIFDVLIFARRDIVEAKIPDFIRCISSRAFQQCAELQSLDFSEKSELESIEESAFVNSSIESITIPSKLVNLEDGWCNGAYGLTHIKIMSDNKIFFYYDDKFIVKKSEPEIDEFDDLIFARRDLTEARIPDSIKIISSHAFQDCIELKKVDFSVNSKLESFEQVSFASSTIKEISIPSTVTKIGDSSFGDCTSLKKVEFSEKSKLTNIGICAFFECTFESIFLPDSLVEIEKNAFGNCIYLKKVQFHENSKLKIIGEAAFIGSSLECISIPSTVIKIDINAFCECHSLQIVEIHESSKLISIYENIFDDSQNVRVMIPSQLKISFI